MYNLPFAPDMVFLNAALPSSYTLNESTAELFCTNNDVVAEVDPIPLTCKAAKGLAVLIPKPVDLKSYLNPDVKATIPPTA